MKLLGLKLNKDILILGLGNIPRFILLIVYTRLQTYFLDYENLSRFYLVFSIYTFFSFIIIGPVGTYVTRNILEWYKSNQINSGLRQIFLKIIIPIAICAFIILALLGSAFEISPNSIYIALIICLIIISKTANELIFPVFNLIDKNLVYLFLVLVFHILNPVFSVVIIKIYEPTFGFWLTGLILSNLVVAIIGWNIISKLPQNNTINCINGHPLNKYVTATWGKCNLCKKNVSKGNIVLDCRKCNYYLCLKCINEINLQYLKTCNNEFEI